MPRLREEELSVSFSDGSEDGFRGVDYPRSVLPNRNITSDDNNDWPASAEAQTRRSGARNWDKNKRGRNQSASSRPKERSRSVSVSRKRGPKTTRATNHKNSSGKKSDRVPSTKKREAKRAAIRKYKSMPSEEEDQHHAFPEVGRISSEDEYVIRSPDYHDDDDDDDDERKSSDREMKKHQPMSPQKKHSKGRMQRHENLQQSDDEIMGEQLKRKHSSKEKITDTTNRRRRSASVDRIRNPEVKEIVRRKTPSRTKSDEKPKARQVKSEKSNRTDESKKMSTENTTTPQRKKSISKRAKSKERRTAKNHIGESHCYGTDDELLYDERGLPTTSVGCPPVATLPRTVSPNCVETERFNTLYAQKLREEEDEYDRGAKRLVCQSEASLVPFSPQETFHPIPIGCLEQRKRAKDFVRCLQTVLQDNNIPDNAILEPVLTNGELIELVDAMFNTQALFEKQGKPPQVEIGYHFCRGSNLRKIKTHPGLWSKIQKRGINASEDGEGIYTFNNPMSSKGASLVTHDDSSWMVIARIQGRHETFVANPTTNCRRKWHHGVDTLVWGGNQQSDDSLVVLKTSSQFFPLLHFRSTLLLGDEANSQRNDLYRQIQNFHLELQNLLDQFFNNRKSKAHGRKRPMSPFEDDKKHPARDQRKIPAATINTPHRSSQKQDSASPKPRQRPRTFSESVGAISNIEAWTLAHEVHEVVEELAMAANVTASFSPPFSVQPVLSKEETAVLADNMFHTQRLFKAWNKPYSYVEIGYHYCRQQSLEKMQELPGFWFNVQKQGYSKSEGGEEGIYVFNNPLSSRNRRNRGGDVMGMQQDLCNNDDVWLLGARIQGCPSTSPTGRLNAGIAGQWEEDADALVVKDVVVLRKASQFFPLLQFKASAVRRSGHPYHDGVIQQIQMVHQRLQGILDGFYNCLTSPEESTCGIHARLPSLKEEVLEYTAPEELDVMWSIHSPILKIYDVHASNKKALKDDCAICLDSLRKTAHHKVARLKVCNHEFHERCLLEAMERFDVCPICSQKLAPPPPPFCLRGLSPSGTMVVSISSQTFCQGCWAPDGGIIISYFMPGGHQEEYHSHPGTPFPNTHLKAYLPYNEQGIKLLRRLQFAFLNGLIWTVETATHSGALVSSIRLGPIPHKLHPCHYTGEGAAETLNDSFPDPFYWDRCNQELDRWGVPSFEQCQGYIVAGRWKERQLDANYGVAMSNMQGLQHATSACRTLLKGLQNHQHGWMFCKALPGTLDNKKIEKPMDLSTVEKKLNHDTYATLEEFTEDILLTFDNALTMHGKENPVHFMAKQLKRKFKKDLKDLLATTTTYTRERNS